MAIVNKAPGVYVIQRDGTATVSSTDSNICAAGIIAPWGPVNDPQRIARGEPQMADIFGNPTLVTNRHFYVAASYLNYNKSMYVVRAEGPAALNAVPEGQTPILIRNDDEFLSTIIPESVPVMARCPGAPGNNIAVCVADNLTFPSWNFRKLFDYKPKEGEVSIVVVDTTKATYQVTEFTVSGTATADVTITVNGSDDIDITSGFTASQIAERIHEVLSVMPEYTTATNESGTAVVSVTHAELGAQTIADTTYSGEAGFTVTSEITVTAVEGQAITGELYSKVVADTSSVKYFKTYINERSDYIYYNTDTLPVAGFTVFEGGANDYDNADMSSAIDVFKNTNKYELDGICVCAVDEEDLTVQQKAIDTMITRGNGIAFVSPLYDDVVNNVGNEADNVLSFREDLSRDTRRAFIDNNWLLVEDEYNSVNIWIPACGATMGIRARTRATGQYALSFAYYNRGQYSNFVKTAWVPDSDEIKELFDEQINSIVTESTGTFLIGEKTGYSEESVFNRSPTVDVADYIAKQLKSFCKRYLGENNNEDTRNDCQLRIQAFLDQLIADDQILDGQAVVDDTNNTDSVVQGHQLVAYAQVVFQYAIDWVIIYLDAETDLTAISGDAITTLS